MIDNWVGYVVGCFVGVIMYRFYWYPLYLSPTCKIPGPPIDHFLLGNVIRLINEEPAEPQFDWAVKYGGIVCYHGIVNKPIISVTDPQLLQKILVNNTYDFPKPSYMISDLKAILGDGILMAEGDAHKRQRKMMNPAFTFTNIKEMVPTIVRVAHQSKEMWKNQIGDNEEKRMIISSFLSKVTLDMIGFVGFKYEFNNITSENELSNAYARIFHQKRTVLNVAVSVLVHYIPWIRKLPLPRNREVRRCIKIIEKFSLKLVKERREFFREGKPIGKDLLSLLVSINENLPEVEKMSDTELQYQIMTFLTAGHETTSSATSWSLYLLAQYPEIQNRLRKELIEAFPDPDFEPTFDEINSLEYLDCVIKESMRIVPPVPIITRTPTRDDVLQEYLVPKNTPIIIPIAAIHKLPTIWGSDADKFIPERWLISNLTSKVNSYTYMPFITGSRSCIGNKLALAEFKILLAVYIRNFKFKRIEGFEVRKRQMIATRPYPAIELIVSKVEV
ncbi:cytochrome P450 [Gigaspora margarita]|uniref:Cytochrome P450 n=1 Tax=Gigaspora margarita TaxID=4874 RepID=A0A8H4EL54_GIGMA|nr:cytochrome P450 [Gigaspora margarita]